MDRCWWSELECVVELLDGFFAKNHHFNFTSFIIPIDRLDLNLRDIETKQILKIHIIQDL